MPQPQFHPHNYINAEETCLHLMNELENTYHSESEHYSIEEIDEYFAKLSAITLVRGLLIKRGRKGIEAMNAVHNQEELT